MVLILSQNEFESTTDKVVRWLIFYKIPFMRVNGDDFIKEVRLKDQKLKYRNLDLSRVKSIWNRRWLGTPEIYDCLSTHEFDIDMLNIGKLISNLNMENNQISNYFFNELRKLNCKWTNPTGKTSVNKLDVLHVAKSLDFNVPETLVTTEKSDVIDFVGKHKMIVNKPISEVVSFHVNRNDLEERIVSLTSLWTEEDVCCKLKKKFKLSLFQENIQKKYEIRVFYLSQNLYSMAIFSQKDSQTKVDFRNYNRRKPNRRVPYKVNEGLHKKIIQLMINLDLNMGSIDLIVDKNDRIYFLEVNPVGQFGMVSTPCNYYLEELLVKYLSNE